LPPVLGTSAAAPPLRRGKICIRAPRSVQRGTGVNLS